MSDKKVIKDRNAVIDIKGALDFYKHQNKGHRLNRKMLSEATGISIQNMTNWSSKENKTLGFILTLHEQTGYPIDQIIKDVSNG